MLSIVRTKYENLAEDHGVTGSSQAFIPGSKTTTGRCSQFSLHRFTLIAACFRNVGFLRYWSFSNAPLFLLAAPMLYIMGQSALWSWVRVHRPRVCRPSSSERLSDSYRSNALETQLDFARNIAGRFVVPELTLALLALTSYHVQIISRISSGYPVWYWWLAFSMADRHEMQIFGQKWNTSRMVVRWMVLYAVLQGGLFSSFLPPA